MQAILALLLAATPAIHNTVKLRGGSKRKIKEFDLTELSDTDRKWLKEKL